MTESHFWFSHCCWWVRQQMPFMLRATPTITAPHIIHPQQLQLWFNLLQHVRQFWRLLLPSPQLHQWPQGTNYIEVVFEAHGKCILYLSDRFVVKDTRTQNRNKTIQKFVSTWWSSYVSNTIKYLKFSLAWI